MNHMYQYLVMAPVLSIYRLTHKEWDFKRRLCRLYTVCFLSFISPCNRKLVSFFALSLYKLLNDCIQVRRLNLTLESSDVKSFI